ncbi:MAG TPA: tRNA (adenosine(37)-N6)-threonylcarbamoyltransferase complex dimerization subunit type 1 TsaB [Flavisolibacter sp.]|nr:tRNA (adenosine(37)-N6)-threonylcarbamoyltransferase complex dimerization subunit type 1 TsaB [Flavisolibacter sp.]
MSLILNIDTAVQSASVCLADGENILATAVNPSEKESASWLHPAVQNLLQENNLQPGDLDAIAVSAGPGSYTGLRVGMAAAKGLCYALAIPLISINTLQMMAAAVKEPPADLLCPMIDARRMEVFTALFDTSLNEVSPSTNLILDKNAFGAQLQQNTILFFGNGSKKAADLINHPNALFVDQTANAAAMVLLAARKFRNGQFADLAYSEPFYGKDFHSPISKKFY